jgi:hypothetical protein
MWRLFINLNSAMRKSTKFFIYIGNKILIILYDKTSSFDLETCFTITKKNKIVKS